MDGIFVSFVRVYHLVLFCVMQCVLLLTLLQYFYLRIAWALKNAQIDKEIMGKRLKSWVFFLHLESKVKAK